MVQQQLHSVAALACNESNPCNGNPCLLGVCLCIDGRGGSSCERGVQRQYDCDDLAREAYRAMKAEPRRFIAYDACAFFDAAYGTVRVDERRWREAQAFEASQWALSPASQTTDRNEHHAMLFDDYSVLPRHLGHVLELGCGPYTQLQTILSSGHRTVDSVTLVDPLAALYVLKVKGCTYRGGRLRGVRAHVVSEPAETFRWRSSRGAGAADTVVMVHMLQSVRDVAAALQSAYEALRPGGLLVFADRVFDARWDEYRARGEAFWDVSHPCAVKQIVIDQFLASFEEVYARRVDPQSASSRPPATSKERPGVGGAGSTRDEQLYFIGRKPT